MRMRVFKFQIYPSWFGGEAQATVAVGELACRQAAHLGMEIMDISIDKSDPGHWLADVKYIPALPPVEFLL